MITKEEAKKHVFSFNKPNAVSFTEWKSLQQWALAIWDATLMQQPWQYKLTVPCKEFFEMISNPTGESIVEDYSLFSFANNANITTWKVELEELAIKLAELKEDAQALKVIDLLLAIDPEFYAAWMLKSRLQLQQKEFKMSAASLAMAIQINPAREEAYMLRAQLHTILGWYQKAVEDFDTAILFTKNRGKVVRLRAQVKWTMNRKREAILDLKKAIKIYPDNEELLCELAEKQFEIGSLNDALTTVNTTLLLNPFQSDALFLKGILMHELGAKFQSKEAIHMAFLLGNPEAGKVIRGRS